MMLEVVAKNLEMTSLMVENLVAHYSDYPEIGFLVSIIGHCYLLSMIDLDGFSNLDYKCWSMESC